MWDKLERTIYATPFFPAQNFFLLTFGLKWKSPSSFKFIRKHREIKRFSEIENEQGILTICYGPGRTVLKQSMGGFPNGIAASGRKMLSLSNFLK